MNRAHDEGLHYIALTLCRYLSSELRLDPNPSGHRPVQAVADSSLKPEPADDATPALVPDLDYTIQQAALVTGLAEATIRKYLSIGRLEGRKENGRVYITGRELARFMAKQLSEANAEESEAVEP